MNACGYTHLHVFACGPKTVLVKRTFLGWGGGGHVNVPCASYIIVCYAAEIFGIVATLLVTTLLLRCRDLWDRCYVTCYYAAEIFGIVATLLVTKKNKKRASFFQVFKSSNQHGTLVKSPFLDTMCTPMSTVSGPAGSLCRYKNYN